MTHDGGARGGGAAAGRVGQVALLVDDLVQVLQLGGRVRLRAAEVTQGVRRTVSPIHITSHCSAECRRPSTLQNRPTLERTGYVYSVSNEGISLVYSTERPILLFYSTKATLSTY